MNHKNGIIEFLKKDELKNLNIINFIENNPIYFIEKIGNSVIAKGISDKVWIYISSRSEDELKIIKKRLDNDDKNFAVIEDWMIPILIEGHIIKWKLSTMKLILSNEIVLDDTKHKISELTINDAEYVFENSEYKGIISLQYIKNRIKYGESSCIYHANKPIAWGMIQDDGAIGFLHVLPEYRKKGYGRDISLDLIKKVRNQNKIPFVHIETNNEKSMRLAAVLGFEKDKVISWFELE